HRESWCHGGHLARRWRGCACYDRPQPAHRERGSTDPYGIMTRREGRLVGEKATLRRGARRGSSRILACGRSCCASSGSQGQRQQFSATSGPALSATTRRLICHCGVLTHIGQRLDNNSLRSDPLGTPTTTKRTLGTCVPSPQVSYRSPF